MSLLGSKLKRGPTATRRQYIVAAEVLALGLLVAYPSLFAGYGLSFGDTLVIYALLALSLDLCWGVAGIISIGHAAFFGIGAYVAAELSSRHAMENGFALVGLGITGAALVGLIVGVFLFTGRRAVGTWYVALTTIALTYAAEQFATGTGWLGADTGIPNVTVSMPLIPDSGTLGSYYALLGILAVAYIGLRVALRTPLGVTLKAIKQDPERLAFLGYAVPLYRVGAFAASAGIAGAAGALMAISNGYVSPSMLGLGLSTQAVLWLLIGGSGTLVGAVLGACALELTSFQLSQSYPTAWQIALGGLIVGFVVLLPGGLVGVLKSMWDQALVLRRRSSASARGMSKPRPASK